MDPIPAFHHLEDLVDRRRIGGPAAEIVQALRDRLPSMRGAPADEWSSFYRDAIRAARSIEAKPTAMTAAERRYVEGLLNDVKDVPSAVAELWSRRLQDQREELSSKAREEVTKLSLDAEVTRRRLRVEVRPADANKWVAWLEHYLRLWSERVVAGVPDEIRRAQGETMDKAPPALAAHVPGRPEVPVAAFHATSDPDWSGLAADKAVPSAWSLFGRSVRGGIFAAMAVATLTGSAATVFRGGTDSTWRGLVVLLLLVPVVIWARLSSAGQRKTAVEDLERQLQSDVRHRLLQATQSRVDARFRALRGWLQRQTRAAKVEAQSWLRHTQLELAEGYEPSDVRLQTARLEIIRELEARVEAIAEPC